MTNTPGRPVVVVTGGTGGVGRATVREFAAHGYDVAVLARGQAGLDGAVRDVEDAGGRCAGPAGRRRRRATAVDAAADRVEPSSARSTCG